MQTAAFIFQADPPEPNGVNRFVLAGLPPAYNAQMAADYAVKYGLTNGKKFKVLPVGNVTRPAVVCREITGNVEITRGPNSAPASRDEVLAGDHEVTGAAPIDTRKGAISEPAFVDGEHAEDPEESGTGTF